MQKDYVPYGSDVSPGTYACVDCGHEYSNQGKTSMPPCPQFRKTAHTRHGWRILTGQGDAVADPYPEKTNEPSGIKTAETFSSTSKK